MTSFARALARGLVIAMVVAAAGCHRRPPPRTTRSGVTLAGPLIPARTTMVTAWEFPQDPETDPRSNDPRLAAEILWGFRLFTNTPKEAAGFVPGKISCNNCHLNGGQRERSLPLVAIAGMFPEYNKRSGRLFTLADRIVDCFLRSENATGTLDPDAHQSADEARARLPSTSSKEVLALAAYLTWLSRGSDMGTNPVWRGQNTIAPAKLMSVDTLDRQKGEAIFTERCISCHGKDGQGVAVGDKKPGPLWGPDSWNDGAGAARVYTLAGIIRYAMPYLDPGSLSDEEAQQLAAFIDGQPRPSFPFKQTDYRTEKMPVDSVYYANR